MHCQFLVTFNKEDAESSHEARGHVYQYLLDNDFCGADTRWGCGFADWFVIGGRYSGDLSRALGKEVEDRDDCQDDGFEDDAMVVNELLYEKLLKGFEDKDDDEDHADLNYDTVSKDFIGKKWVVLVDYHI